jgi:hypothetical protein
MGVRKLFGKGHITSDTSNKGYEITGLRQTIKTPFVRQSKTSHHSPFLMLLERNL